MARQAQDGQRVNKGANRMTRDNYEDEREPLNLRYEWECDKCGTEASTHPNEADLEPCPCGGAYRKTGESYNA